MVYVYINNYSNCDCDYHYFCYSTLSKFKQPNGPWMFVKNKKKYFHFIYVLKMKRQRKKSPRPFLKFKVKKILDQMSPNITYLFWFLLSHHLDKIHLNLRTQCIFLHDELIPNMMYILGFSSFTKIHLIFLMR